MDIEIKRVENENPQACSFCGYLIFIGWLIKLKNGQSNYGVYLCSNCYDLLWVRMKEYENNHSGKFMAITEI